MSVAQREKCSMIKKNIIIIAIAFCCVPLRYAKFVLFQLEVLVRNVLCE